MKNQKMTKKEFIEVFEAAGFSFEVWGWEGILNMIAGYNDFLAQDAAKLGQNKIVEMELKKAKYIEEYLSKRGYYNRSI